MIMEPTMLMTRIARLRRLSVIAALLLAAAVLGPSAAHAQVAESPEIVYSGTDAQALRDKASQLGTAVTIYEYLHNTIEYSPYHGSRSGSINTFLGQRGSDVDIATTLIAMLRAQGIPARYAVGTMRVPAAQLTNWLGIGSLDVAVQILKDQGIQRIVLASDRSTVDFEHAWAEAFVPFDQYRGINTVYPAVDCAQTTNAARCTWVALDASFKQKTYNGLNLDPYNAVVFDYTAYYNAIKNNDTARRDKNPLAILEDQIGSWLRTNYPGKTLEDVEDAGKIVELSEGLLPASLPYQVIGTIRRYDSVALHDAAVPGAEPKKWGKTVQVGVKFDFDGYTYQVDGLRILLAGINTKRLGISTELTVPDNVPNMVVRLDGQEIFRPISENSVPGFVPTIGYPFMLTLLMDGVPGVTSGEADRTISTNDSAIIGGYYLIATGGEASNWSQVHRAANQLLAANDQYKIVFNPADPGSNGLPCDFASGTNCTPYVDATGNGWDTSDKKLLDDKAALDALTGGLLYSGATQYYAKQREQFERADRLMKTKTPVIGFLGVASSVYEVEYIDGTAFSILPGGLLLDMKNSIVGGVYRANEAAVNYSNRQIEFLGHIGSSLEHETWQELTGYDAVSTMRGIQMALAGGASLVNVKRDTVTNTVPGFLTSMGFGATTPSPFAIVQYDIYGTSPTTWSHPTTTSSESFHALKKAPNSISDSRLKWPNYRNDGWHLTIKCFDDTEGQLISLRATYGGSQPLQAATSCGVSWADGTTIDNAITIFRAGYDSFRSGSNTEFFNYLDVVQGFNSADFAYRTTSLATNAYSTDFVARIRNDLLLRDINASWVEYLLPSTLVEGCTYRFEVDIRKEYIASTGRLNNLTFEIANRSQNQNGCP